MIHTHILSSIVDFMKIIECMNVGVYMRKRPKILDLRGEVGVGSLFIYEFIYYTLKNSVSDRYNGSDLTIPLVITSTTQIVYERKN